MALLKILTFPDPILRKKAQLVTSFDEGLKSLVSNMFETMYDAPGVGLAANQVGVLSRILVLDVDYKIEVPQEGESGASIAVDSEFRIYSNKNPRVFINPVILKKERKLLYLEGCLSVPGVTEEVERSESIEMTFQSIDGGQHVLCADGLLAIAIQHEIDHLEGRLFIDRLSDIKKLRIKSKIKKDRGAPIERSKFHVEL